MWSLMGKVLSLNLISSHVKWEHRALWGYVRVKRRCTACSRVPELKALPESGHYYSRQWFQDNFPTGMLLSPCHGPAHLPLRWNANTEEQEDWLHRKSQELTTLACVDHRDREKLQVTWALLFAGGTSVNRWQSLSLSRRAQSRNAEVQPSAASAPPGATWWWGGAGAPQAQAMVWYQELGICPLRKECLTQSPPSPQFLPFTGML